MSLAYNTSDAEVTQGVVYKKSQGHYGVRVNGNLIDCEISSRLRKQLEYPIAAPTSRRHRVLDVHEIRVIDPIAIGDVVQFLRAGDARASSRTFCRAAIKSRAKTQARVRLSKSLPRTLIISCM